MTNRMTIIDGLHGLVEIFSRAVFAIERLDCIGHSLEVCGLITNLALARNAITFLEKRSPLAILVVLLPIAFLLINIFSVVASWLNSADNTMPFRYSLIVVKSS